MPRFSLGVSILLTVDLRAAEQGVDLAQLVTDGLRQVAELVEGAPCSFPVVAA